MFEVFISLVKNGFEGFCQAKGEEKSKSILKDKNLLEKCLLIST